MNAHHQHATLDPAALLGAWPGDGVWLIPAGLFLTGLAGSFTHCVGMCGPFVVSQVGAGLAARPVADYTAFGRLRGGLLAPYHLGRATTYGGLGALAGGLAGGLADLVAFRWLASGALLVGGVLFLLHALSGWWPALSIVDRRAPDGWGRAVAALARPLLADPGGWRGYLLGLTLGLLPCGLIYAALAASAGAGGAWQGAIAMIAFAAGTAPGLLLVGTGAAALGRLSHRIARAARFAMAANGAFLIYLALSTSASTMSR